MYAIQFKNMQHQQSIVQALGIVAEREYDDEADKTVWIEANLTAPQITILRNDRRVMYFSEL